MNVTWNRSWLIGLSFVAACTVEVIDRGGSESVADGEDDQFLTSDGKLDAAGIADGSVEACRVLRFSNTTDKKGFETIKLDARANKNILAYRAGPDAKANTADDRVFSTLAELDAIKYVGTTAFKKLLAAANVGELACSSTAIQLLSVSDWHGQLDPVSVPNVGNIGGAAALSTIFATARAANPNTLTLTAGDAFGATPPLSSFFEDEPSVLAMNLMGFDADSLGNHNFDAGLDHLESMVALADFPYLTANLSNVNDNITCEGEPSDKCTKAYQVFTVGGVKVAVIGLTNPDAASLSKPESLGTIKVTDPAGAARKSMALARVNGARVFVLLVHMGATGKGADGRPTGPLMDLANQLQGFDVILGDHTNVQVNEMVNGALVVENKSSGVTYAKVTLAFDDATQRVNARTAELLTPMADTVAPDAKIVDLLAPYRTELAKAFDGKIATTTGLFARGNNVERLAEMPIGDLVADSLRVHYGTQLGFTNGGGIRAPLPSSYQPLDKTLRRPDAGFAAGPPYDLVVGDVFAVLPFGNSAVTRTVSGKDLWAMMEHSVEALPAPNGWFGQISGFKFTFDSSKPAKGRVLSITLDDGTAVLADDVRYTLATSDFIADGGDGYTMLAGGDGVSREKMADVLLEHIKALAALDPKTGGRIVDVSHPTP